jgi:ribonuclease R
MNKTIDKESVLNFFKTKATKPVSVREITRDMKVDKTEVPALKRILRTLTKSGDIYRTRTGLFGQIDKMNLFTGAFEAHKDGFGFVISEKSGMRDLFIPPRKTLGAMTGDRVVARVESPVRMEGSIIKILERGQQRIIGELCREKNSFYVKPKGKRVPFFIMISPGDRRGAKDGDKVVVEITSFPTEVKPPEGKVLKILPHITEPAQEVELIIEEYSLPGKFPAGVRQETAGFSPKASARNRVDCRKLLTVTIDGETAKDFDDAISIERTDSGYILYVHIADVSHYVPWDSKLDMEARQRGTSVYFPGNVIPMLPERLSNDLCSLVPKKDRMTVTAEMHFDKDGLMIDKAFYTSIINSNERLTYTAVKKVLADKDRDERKKYAHLLKDLGIMEDLYNLIRKQRIKRGSLDFDLPEPEILLDIQGNPEAIIKSERNLAHMMIEDFMISANEAVGSHLEKLGIPSLYRVHEKPDTAKLEELKPIFNSLGLNVKKSGPELFQSILKKTKGRPEEPMLNILLLRALKQAKYSEKNIGHFGLASECYAHFTSPIRRYPDLIVHRILKESVDRKKFSENKKKELSKLLPEIAVSSSKTERNAVDAERDIISALRVWFMKDKVGNEYEGIVTKLSAAGIKVQLKDFFIEGFLHVSALNDDYYVFDDKTYRLTGRRTKRVFSLGKEITVRIDRVDTEERDIGLGLVKDNSNRTAPDNKKTGAKIQPLSRRKPGYADKMKSKLKKSKAKRKRH